ncbi:MAG TPA: methyl-accepting chemotaxis protein [Quisquiliibacterium sp.]|nr:methyl-accepting chemotaxis protein [Quisquiliibacterium sp.]
MNRVIGNLRLAGKFFLIGLLCLIMCGIPFTLVVLERIDEHRVLRLEQRAMAPARDLLGAVRLLQQHRGLSAGALSGNAAAAAALKEKRVEVEAALGVSAKSLQGFGNADLVSRAATLAQDWSALRAAYDGGALKAPESFTRHTNLINGQLRLLDELAVVSGLSLDSEAGTYFTVVAVLNHLPQLTESLGQLRARGTSALTRGELSPEDRATLIGLLGAARSAEAGAALALERAVKGEPELRRAFESTGQTASTKAAEMFRLVESLFLATDKASIEATAYFAQTTQAIDAQFALIDTAFPALHRALDVRVAQAGTLIALVVGAMLAGLVIGALLIRAILGTLKRSVEAAKAAADAMAEGDLTVDARAETRDEVGMLVDAIGRSRARLEEIIRGIRAASESVATASGEIAQGNLDLSSRTEEQASSLQQTAASMEQMAASVRASAQTAQDASRLAGDALDAAQQGGQVFSSVNATMQQIHQSSQRIAEIIAVVDSISFQTNILALNAAVESARAGEHGRGFAVVASEVRQLAHRSAEAAREIKDLIGESVGRVEAGTRTVEEAGTAIQRIVERVGQVSAMIDTIHSASGEQSIGIGEVNTAVSQLDMVTQQNAALVEQASAVSASLRDQAARMQESVSIFRIA